MREGGVWWGAGHNLGVWREAPERSWQEEMWVLPADFQDGWSGVRAQALGAVGPS